MERNLSLPTGYVGEDAPYISARRNRYAASLLPQTREATPPSGLHILAHLAQSLNLPVVGAATRPSAPDTALTDAYRVCAEIIRHHSKSFYFSARLLPPSKRQSIMALYAFCRTSDDLVDATDAATCDKAGARENARLSMEKWTKLVANPISPPQSSALSTQHSTVARAWADTRGRHKIPRDLADELLAGVRMDLTINRYETWDDLWLYCYRVASTVGLMSMYVMGAETLEAVPYAVQLGVALQLTNILRDVGEDARAGRIYLPLEEMQRFGYTEEMLMSGTINRGFVSLMDFQIARANALYRSALPGVALLSPDSRLAVTAAATLYQGILRKIVAARYDVFNHRAHLSATEKLRALPAIWWKSKRARLMVSG